MRDQKMRFWKGIREDGMELIVATRGGTSFCSPEVAACSPAYAIRNLKDGRNILRNCFHKVKKAAKNEGLALDRTLLVGAVLMPLDRRGRVNPGNRFIGAVAEFRKDGFWQAIKWHAAEIRQALRLPVNSTARREVFAQTRAVGVPFKKKESLPVVV